MIQPLADVPTKPPAAHMAGQAAPRARIIAMAMAGLALVLAAIAGLLWFQYGAAVFFDIVAAGIAACF